jgi:cysteine desulfurase
MSFFILIMIYLDNSATTELDPQVLEAMLPYFGAEYGNPSSIYSLGREARIALEDARARVAASIGAQESEIVFTSGGTEANNHALTGAVFAAKTSGTPFHEQQVIVSSVEHHAVLDTTHFLSSLGVQVNSVPVGNDGIVLIGELERSLSPKTTIVSIMAVNNEVGSINPIRELASLVHAKSSLIHTDAVQALGKVKIDVHEMGVDLLTVSAHKVHGPKGIGALFIRRGLMIEPMLHGGAQERNRRGGTESVALAVGFAKAAELVVAEEELRRKNIEQLHSYLVEKLREIPEVLINSPLEGKSVHSIISITFSPKILAHIEKDTLIMRFDLDGIAVSNGSACTSGTLQPSHVLMAMGKGNDVASGSVRISLSKDSTKEHIDAFIRSLTKILSEAGRALH